MKWLGLMLLAGCGAPAALSLTEANTGSAFTVALGGTVGVELRVPPWGSPAWRTVLADQRVLVAGSDEVIDNNIENSDGWDWQTVGFTAIGHGTADVGFTCPTCTMLTYRIEVR